MSPKCHPGLAKGHFKENFCRFTEKTARPARNSNKNFAIFAMQEHKTEVLYNLTLTDRQKRYCRTGLIGILIR